MEIIIKGEERNNDGKRVRNPYKFIVRDGRDEEHD